LTFLAGIFTTVVACTYTRRGIKPIMVTRRVMTMDGLACFDSTSTLVQGSVHGSTANHTGTLLSH